MNANFTQASMPISTAMCQNQVERRMEMETEVITIDNS